MIALIIPKQGILIIQVIRDVLREFFATPEGQVSLIGNFFHLSIVL